MLGGVGGTVTQYSATGGYWIREEGRDTLADLPTCRLDLAVGYGMADGPVWFGDGRHR
ncbi:MAG: hypothetical protein R3C56_13440 [Pirellulaceae bacterium]